MATLLTFFQWLESTRGSVALHESEYMYPFIESIHVLTLCLFMGLVIMLDFRLTGLALRRVPVSEVVHRVLPWAIAGFVVMVITGVLLVYAIPVRTFQNVFFRVKVVLLMLAGLNVWVFHWTVFRRVDGWDLANVTPKAAKLAGTFSLVLWTGVILAGRMIAYNWFDPQ